ncbi:hypothetical protein [Pseudomonas sp. TH31]|uniref:hypothetical protein n=1 Tax=Pseudomonas sp. TH31 TaxID=2796396 RepID=UPI00406D384C
MVSLARTLLARPNLLLLDEPTSAMDTQTEAVFLQHLQRATEGQTLVVVTHRPSLLALVQRIVVVEDGKVVADGPKETILAAMNSNSRKPVPQNAPKGDSDNPVSVGAMSLSTRKTRPVAAVPATDTAPVPVKSEIAP